MSNESSTAASLPERVVVGANGAYWRDFGDYYSMCLVSTDNDPVEVVAAYVRVDSKWHADREGNKLILLFEGLLYGDQSVSEGMVVAAIHRFRTKQPIELAWLGIFLGTYER